MKRQPHFLTRGPAAAWKLPQMCSIPLWAKEIWHYIKLTIQNQTRNLVRRRSSHKNESPGITHFHVASNIYTVVVVFSNFYNNQGLSSSQKDQKAHESAIKADQLTDSDSKWCFLELDSHVCDEMPFYIYVFLCLQIVSNNLTVSK